MLDHVASMLAMYRSDVSFWDELGCVNDVRFNGEWLPMDQSQNKESRAADYMTRSQNIEDGCPSDACFVSISLCPFDLICVDMWRHAECRLETVALIS